MPATCLHPHDIADALANGEATLVACPCGDGDDVNPDCWLCMGDGEAVRMPDGTVHPYPAGAPTDLWAGHDDACRCTDCDPDWHTDLAAGL